jgi:hypothetical protein
MQDRFRKDDQMADDRMREKIRAMLAKAKPGSGATEEEAASAMAMAMTLMAKFGIQVSLEEGEDQHSTWGGPTERNNYMMWHNECAGAAAVIYSCRHFIWTTDKGYQFEFVGRPDNIEAAKMTFLWLTDQVEALYKEALPPGLSKSTRAELRRTFKYACAIRIRGRAWKMMESLRNDDTLAIAATGSTALVIVKHDDALKAEADSLIAEKSNGRTLTVRPRKAGVGTLLGFQAGDRVELNKQLGVKQKALPSK